MHRFDFTLIEDQALSDTFRVAFACLQLFQAPGDRRRIVSLLIVKLGCGRQMVSTLLVIYCRWLPAASPAALVRVPAGT